MPVDNDNPLLEKIRAERDKDTDNGDRSVRETVDPVQAKFRLTTGETGENIYQSASDTTGSASRDRAIQGNAETDGRVNRIDRPDIDAVNVRDGGVDTSDKEPDRSIERPSGLALQPSKREHAARQEAAAAQPGKKQRVKRIKVEESEPVVEETSPPGLAGVFARIKGNRARAPKRERPLSDKEAETMREPLRAAMIDYFGYMDEAISLTARGHRKPVIWSSIDDEEVAILVDAMLAHGKRNAKGAARVVFIINTHHQLKVGLILLPRFYQTFQFYSESGGVSLR